MNSITLARFGKFIFASAMTIGFVGCEEPVIEHVFPQSGPASGGTVIYVTGSDLPSDAQCIFAKNTEFAVSVPALRINDNELQCESPRFPRFETVSLRVENGSYGKDVDGGYAYYLQPSVQTLQYRVFAKAGGGPTRVSIFPAGRLLETATCGFRVNDELFVGTSEVENEQEMVCHAPAMDRTGMVYLEISNNGYDFTDDRMDVEVEASAEIYRVDPEVISVSNVEGDSIRIEGAGFTEDTEVMIGENPCRSLNLLSHSEISCVPAPSDSPRSEKIRIKVFPSVGEPHLSAQSVNFRYE